MTILDSNIRNMILFEDQGGLIGDTTDIVEETPQLNVNHGVVNISFKFEDGDGLTDEYGNIYEGYGGAGGSSKITSTNGIELADLADVSNYIPTDGQVLAFNNSSGLWTPEDPAGGGVAELDDLDDVTITTPQSGDILLRGATEWENQPLSDFNFIATDGTAPEEGDLLQYIGGNWVPVTNDEAGLAQKEIEDYIAALIETPTVKTYILTYQLPYDITITATADNFGAGSGTVNFPSGTITEGNNVEVTLSGLSGDAADLSLRIDFTRDLNA